MLHADYFVRNTSPKRSIGVGGPSIIYKSQSFCGERYSYRKGPKYLEQRRGRRADYIDTEDIGSFHITAAEERSCLAATIKGV